ncbi:MAG: amidohydrolase family protein [Chloroflexi bacterium]|nr:amidohydrolase family protein [Chloroflexota bacterium]
MKNVIVPLFADMVLINGKIVTVDKKFSLKQAIAVRDKKILAAGTNDEINVYIGKNTKIIDLKGKTVLPGINDDHTHASLFGGTLFPQIIDLHYPVVKSIADIQRKIKEKIATMKPGEWVWGWGWMTIDIDELKTNPSREPTKADLDPVSPDNPVVLGDFSCHTSWVNSKALKMANINNKTKIAYGAEIRRLPGTDEPSGLIIDFPALAVLMNVFPQLSRQQKRKAIMNSQKVFTSLGITTVTDSALGTAGELYQGGLIDTEIISVYNDLHNEGKLTVRMNLMPFFGEHGAESYKAMQEGIRQMGVHTGFGDDWLRIAGTKIFADGGAGPLTRGAWNSQPYPTGGHGCLVLPGKTDEEKVNELENMISYANKRGFQIGIHSAGDLTCKACMNGLVKAIKEHPWDARHYLIHGVSISDEDIPRARENNIGLCTQPGLWNLSVKGINSGNPKSAAEAEKRLADSSARMRKLIDAGVVMSASSDTPVTYPDWIEGVFLLVNYGHISREEAIRMYTINGAWQNHLDHKVGSIEPGKLADFCILDNDILTINPQEIQKTKNVMTIVGGEIIYKAF